MACLVCQGDMERDKIGGGKQLQKRHRPAVETLFFFGKETPATRVDDRHSKAGSTARYGPADTAHSHDSQCATMHLGAKKLRRPPPGPAGFTNQALAFWDSAGDREQKPPGQIGGRLSEHIGSIRDDDPPRRGCRNVDIVIARRVDRDDPKSLGAR